MADQEIFLSWSKSASRTAAETFREYLPQLLPVVKPWMSSLDIAKGTAWFTAISDQLARSRACLLLITPENIGSSWLYYEAGAIAHAFAGSRVFPYLIGVRAVELGATPLGQYQVTIFEREDTKKLIHDLNMTLETPIHEAVLSSAFDGVWPKLQRKLVKIPLTKPVNAVPSPPSPRQLSQVALEILMHATTGDRHIVTVSKTMHGFNLGAGGKDLANNMIDDRREAELRAAVSELLSRGMIVDKGTKGEVFGLTNDGYSAADEAKKHLPPELSVEAKQILIACSGKDGQVMGHLDSQGYHLSAGRKQICLSKDDRVVAGFTEAIDDLVNRGFLRVDGDEIWQITRAGYKVAEGLTPQPADSTPPVITDEADILVHLQGWMHKKFHSATRTTPIIFAEVDRELNLLPGSSEKLLERAAEKLNWTTDSKGTSLIAFRRSRISSG
jgi:hypothetical protein